MDAADELVVVRCQLGEREAFRELVERWHAPLWTFLRRMTGDAGRSDDLAQDVWVRVVRGLPRLAKPDRFPAWIFTLARRAVVDELRQAYQRPGSEPEQVLDGADRSTPADEVGALLDRLELDRALATLTPRDREAVVLFHLADLPLADVAQVLAVPEGTVKSRLHRARAQLRAELSDRGLPS